MSNLPDGLSSGFLGPCGPVAKIVSSPMAGWTDHLLVNSFILNTQDRPEFYDQDYLDWTNTIRGKDVSKKIEACDTLLFKNENGRNVGA